MIFVTVGTHEQPFNRLIEAVDHLKRDGKIQDEVIIQIGYSTYMPQYCTWYKLLPYKQMEQYVHTARIVITHGGPASFMMALQSGKTPIVAPRQARFGEHVNDHQVEFVKRVAEQWGTLLPVVEMEELEEMIVNYDRITGSTGRTIISHNAKFNEELEKIISGLLEG